MSLANDIIAIHNQYLKIEEIKRDLVTAEDYLSWMKILAAVLNPKHDAAVLSGL